MVTIWEVLFGTPERTADTLDGADKIDLCDWMETLTHERMPTRCEQCVYESDRYGCYDRDGGMGLLEWLTQEVRR